MNALAHRWLSRLCRSSPGVRWQAGELRCAPHPVPPSGRPVRHRRPVAYPIVTKYLVLTVYVDAGTVLLSPEAHLRSNAEVLGELSFLHDLGLYAAECSAAAFF